MGCGETRAEGRGGRGGSSLIFLTRGGNPQKSSDYSESLTYTCIATGGARKEASGWFQETFELLHFLLHEEGRED